MKRNVGGADRVIRIVLGAVLVAAGFLVPLGNIMRIVLFVVAGILLITGGLGSCGLYTLLRIDTCRRCQAG